MAKRRNPTTPPQSVPLTVFDNSWTKVLDRRELPPIAMAGLTAAMLRNVPMGTLVNTLAPALREMVKMTEKDVEAFFEDDRVFTFEAWLESFEFDPQSDYQVDTWTPFVKAMKALSGSKEVGFCHDDAGFYNRHAGMLFWLTIQVLFDTVSNEFDEIEGILPPMAGWLPLFRMIGASG